MKQLGDPISYLQVEMGVPVISSEGETIGTLEHVLADEDVDIFDGIIIDSSDEFGRWRFADAAQVAALYEGAVVLALRAHEALELPEPSENPPAMATDPDDATPDSAGDKLRRAWDYISGKY